MKIVFVKNKTNLDSLAALGAALEKEKLALQVLVIEEKALLAKLKSLTKGPSKIVIAFSFQTPDFFRIQKLVSQIKKENLIKNGFLIASGAHSSGAPQATLKMGFDHVFVGEAEVSFGEFLKSLIKGEKIVNRIIKGRPVDLARFLSISEKYQLFGPIEISRGCPYGCFFLPNHFSFWTGSSPDCRANCDHNQNFGKKWLAGYPLCFPKLIVLWFPKRFFSQSGFIGKNAFFGPVG